MSHQQKPSSSSSAVPSRRRITAEEEEQEDDGVVEVGRMHHTCDDDCDGILLVCPGKYMFLGNFETRNCKTVISLYDVRLATGVAKDAINIL
jgi:hypothetical protein